MYMHAHTMQIQTLQVVEETDPAPYGPGGGGGGGGG